jgi:hypothetical protein
MKKLHLVLALAAVIGVSTSSNTVLFAQTSTTKAAKTTKAPTATAAPSAADIADAKSKGLVWVNLSSKKYHKSDNKYYGATKSGKFMTEADAQKAGYVAAKDEVPKTKSTTKK